MMNISDTFRYFFYLLILTGYQATAQKSPPLIEEFLQKWKNSKTYTVDLVRSFPESQLDYRPVDSIMTFQQQIVHLTIGIIWHSGTYLKEKDFGRTIEPDMRFTKAELIKNLEEAYDFSEKIIRTLTPTDLDTRVDFFAGNFTKRQILNLLDDHVTHHRAQLIIYLRLNGIAPPRYTGW